MKANIEVPADEVKSLKDVLKHVDVTPDKDFEIHHNQFHIKLQKGVSTPVPRKFLQNLVTEGVIKKIPKN